MAFDQAFQEKMVHKALNRSSVSLESFAISQSIGYSTIQKWLAKFKAKTYGSSPHWPHFCSKSNINIKILGRHRDRPLQICALFQKKEEKIVDAKNLTCQPADL